MAAGGAWRRALVAVNVANLDAPAVAVAWAALLARAAGRSASAGELGLLAAGVWLGYAADRLLDGRRLGGRAQTARHRAAARRPALLALVWGAVFVVALWQALERLAPPLLARAVALAALVAAYTLAVATWPRAIRRAVPRELAVGVLFAAGTTLFAFGAAPPSAGAVPLALGFTALCVANCVAVALAEVDRDRAAGETSCATQWPWLARAFVPGVGSGAFVAATAAAVGAHGPFAPAWLAIAAAALGLLALHRYRAGDAAPALADLCLCVAAALALAVF